jgi:hypothetical protein
MLALRLGEEIVMSQQEFGTAGQILVLATERKAHAFDLLETFRIAIGRHESNDLQLDARAVSNYHAEILNEGDALYIRDMGSTNGTFVNGRKVRRQRLSHGDEVKISNHVITVRLMPRQSEDAQQALQDSGVFVLGRRGILLPSRPGTPRSLTPPRDSRDLSLSDLLGNLAAKGRSTTLLIRRENNTGRIFLDKGQLVHAECGEALAEKALYRLLGWTASTYEIAEYPKGSVPRTITLPLETLIKEGLVDVEGRAVLAGHLPSFEVSFGLNEGCGLPLNALSAVEVEILQGLMRHETIGRLLDKSPLPDAKILSAVRSLLQKEVVAPRETTALLEQTSLFRGNKPHSA